MIFRLSQKMSTKLKTGILAVRPLDENPFADWSAHLFSVDRTLYIIQCNTKSLYSTVIYGKGITTASQYIQRALDSIREVMEANGNESAYRDLIAPASASVCFAKALNRSVTGSLNDLIYHANVWLTEGELSPYDVAIKLNNIPFSPLEGPGRATYGTPRQAFKIMLNAAGRSNPE